MTARPIPPAVLEVVAAWQEGWRSSTLIAQHLGISPQAAKHRLHRARLAGLIGPAPRVRPEAPTEPSPLRSIALATVAGGAWRSLTETVAVTVNGRVIAEWMPVDAAMPSSRTHIDGIPEHQPAPLTLEIARIAAEVAQALAELEELRDTLRPQDRLRSSRRQSDAIRHRARYARLVHELADDSTKTTRVARMGAEHE